MAEDEDEPDYENFELQELDDDRDNVYEEVGTKTTPTAQDNDSQKIQQSGIRWNRPVGVCVGLLCAVLALISIGAPLYLNHSNMVEREQQLARINILTEERDQLQTSFDQMKTRYNHLIAQNNQLQTSLNQLKTSHNNLTEERDDMKRRLSESTGWQKLGRGSYYVSTEKKNWEESRQWCSDRLSDLMIIKSKEKQDFVKSANKQGVWLGLTDKASEGSFQWVDGTPLTSPTYWESGQPNNVARDSDTEQDCVEFLDFGWNDRSCSFTNYWICERVQC